MHISFTLSLMIIHVSLIRKRCAVDKSFMIVAQLLSISNHHQKIVFCFLLQCLIVLCSLQICEYIASMYNSPLVKS
jgi:hypothetical protein